MSKWLKADCAAGSAYAEKTSLGLVTGSGFSVELDVVVPSATLSAIFSTLGGGQFTGNPLTLQSLANSQDGVFGWDTTGIPTWRFTTNHDPGPGSGSLVPDTSFHLKYQSVWNAGTLRSDITVFIDGVSTITYSTTAFGGATDTVDELRVGGDQANGIAGEIYYVDNVVVKDGSGTTVFSDDFESGTFAAWTSHTAGTSIVDLTAVDFTISASPSTVTFTSPGTASSTITVGEVNSPESVSLTLDTSGLPAEITAALDVASVTTPGTAKLTVTATVGAACDSYPIVVTGDDGTNTHTVTVTVVVDAAGHYDTTPTPYAQAGSSLAQVGDINEGTLAVHKGRLYAAWTETVSGGGNPLYGPYLARWNGSDWDLLANGAVFGEVDGTGSKTRPKLATDGTNLYLAYLAERSASWPDCRNPGSDLTESPFYAIVWKWDGSTWTSLGEYGSGAVINDGNYGDENSGGDSASVALELSASTDEPGACYVAFFEEGFEGPNAAEYWASRHLRVAGCGSSTLGTVVFDGDLFQPDRPTSGGICTPSTDFSPQIYSMRLVGAGDKLTLYMQDPGYSQFTAAFWTIMKVWQRTGYLADVTLATDFPTPFPDTLIGYEGPIVVSNDHGGRRYVAVPRVGSFFGTHPIVRQCSPAAPEAFSATWGVSDATADFINPDSALIAESGRVWSLRRSTGAVQLLQDRCGLIFWQTPGDEFNPSGYTGNPGLFDDALWFMGKLSGPHVDRLPICRDCGSCCGLTSALAVFRNMFKAGIAASAAPVSGDASPVFDPSFHFQAGASDAPAPPSAGAATPFFSATPFKG